MSVATNPYEHRITKTFIVQTGRLDEVWPVDMTDNEHTFGCYTVGEAMRDVLYNTIRGIPCRIVATQAWVAENGTIEEYLKEKSKVSQT